MTGKRSDWLSYLQTGMEMSAAVGIGFLAGFFADGKLGTAPWLCLAGSGFGIAAALRIAFRAVARSEGK